MEFRVFFRAFSVVSGSALKSKPRKAQKTRNAVGILFTTERDEQE